MGCATLVTFKRAEREIDGGFMPLETIGSVDTGQIPGDIAWIEWAMEIALSYIDFVCGDPPEGSRLQVHWRDHDLGSYPILGAYFEGTPSDEWLDYLRRCEAALEVLNEAVSWSELKDHMEAEFDEQYVEDD